MKIKKTGMLLTLLGVLAVAGSAQGDVLLFDDFDGPTGGPLDTTKWQFGGGGINVSLSGSGDARHDSSADILTGTFQTSVDSFLYEDMTFSVNNNAAAHGWYGYEASSDDNILIRADLDLIVVRKGGITQAFPTFDFKSLSSALVNIEWSPTQLRVLVDGSEQLNITDPAMIPNIAMPARFRTYDGGGGPGTINFGSVQVGTPGPPTFQPTPYTRTAFDAADLSINNGNGYKDSDNLNGAVTWSEGGIMGSYLRMYDVTGDTFYLDKFVDHADSVLATRDDFANFPHEVPGNNPIWSDSFGLVSTPITTGLIVLPMARFARMVNENPALAANPTYQAKANLYLQRTQESVDWLNTNFLYSLGGGRSGYRIVANGPLQLNTTHIEATMGNVLRNMYYAGGDQSLIDLADRLARTVVDFSLFTTNSGNLAWMYQYGGTSDPDDISHGAYAAPFIAEMIQDGRIFTPTQGRALAASIIEDAYQGNGQVSAGMDGSSIPEARIGSNPWIWSWGVAGGLIELAQFDMRLLPVAEAVFTENYPNAPEVYGWQVQAMGNLVRYGLVPQIASVDISVVDGGQTYSTTEAVMVGLLGASVVTLINESNPLDMKTIFLSTAGTGDESAGVWDLTLSLDPDVSGLDGGVAEITFSMLDANLDIKELLAELNLPAGFGAVTVPNGLFTTISGTLAPSSQDFSFSFGETTVVQLPGDFNNDNSVDGADFLAWQRNLGDAPNLTLWETNYGATAALAAAQAAVAAVPEPGSLALCILGLVLLSGRYNATFGAGVSSRRPE